jgi:hypothetical protein
MAAQDVRRAERERVSKVIAEVRAMCPDWPKKVPFEEGWLAACDAVASALEGDNRG